MIEVRDLAKRYGAKTAVDGVSFTVSPGKVTGFLGPNGAGKSTTMRMILGLDRPTHGRALVNGLPYPEHRNPLHQVGALLDAKAMHPGRTAIQHLRAMAATHNIPQSRVAEVIDMTGLSVVAKKRTGGFSLGMGQRLGIANALLGDPQTIMLDEPVNGLDPEGVLWVRNLVRSLAGEGKTVFLSSHLMSEMAQTADHVIVIGRGKIVADTPLQELLAGAQKERVRVRTTSIAEFTQLLTSYGAAVEKVDEETLNVLGLQTQQIAQIALDHRILVYELAPVAVSLEDVYFELTKDEVEYQASVETEPHEATALRRHKKGQGV